MWETHGTGCWPRNDGFGTGSIDDVASGGDHRSDRDQDYQARVEVAHRMGSEVIIDSVELNPAGQGLKARVGGRASIHIQRFAELELVDFGVE